METPAGHFYVRERLPGFAGRLPEVETVPWGERAGDRVDVDRLRYGCRLAAERGADVGKTEFPGHVTAMSA